MRKSIVSIVILAGAWFAPLASAVVSEPLGTEKLETPFSEPEAADWLLILDDIARILRDFMVTNEASSELVGLGKKLKAAGTGIPRTLKQEIVELLSESKAATAEVTQIFLPLATQANATVAIFKRQSAIREAAKSLRDLRFKYRSVIRKLKSLEDDDVLEVSRRERGGVG